MKYKLLYYTQYDGAWLISDSGIRLIWDRMVAEGADKKVFYAGEIDSADRFILYFKSPQTFPFFIYTGDAFNIDNVAAIVWVTGIRAKSGLMHFCVFKSAYGDGYNLARCAFAYIFSIKDSSGRRVLDSIRGETPKFNSLAIRYLKTIGMNIVGEIPHMAQNKHTREISSMVISYITYDCFNGGKNE